MCRGMPNAMSFRVHTVRRMEQLIGVAAIAPQEIEERECPDPPIVLVTWHDAWADTEQHDSSEWRSDYLIRTTGFLVREGSDILSVAQEILPNDDGFRAVTHIPRRIVEGMVVLRSGSTPAVDEQ